MSEIERASSAAEDVAGALDSADWSNVSIGNKALISAAIARLRVKQEPVGYASQGELDCLPASTSDWWNKALVMPAARGEYTVPLYASQPADVGALREIVSLAVEEARKQAERSGDANDCASIALRRIANEIDAALATSGGADKQSDPDLERMSRGDLR